jgi:hypothetical protein
MRILLLEHGRPSEGYAVTRRLEQKAQLHNFPEADLVGPRAMARMPMNAKLKAGNTPRIAS